MSSNCMYLIINVKYIIIYFISIATMLKEAEKRILNVLLHKLSGLWKTLKANAVIGWCTCCLS